MKTIIYCTALAVWVLSLTTAFAQEEQNASVEALEKAKENVVSEEKDALKIEVENINQMLDQGNITSAEAEEMKQAAAEKRALNIENRVAILENKIQLLKRNEDSDVLDLDNDSFVLRIGGDNDKNDWIFFGKKNAPPKYDRRTTGQLVFSFGLNNTIIEGQSLDDSPYEIGGSRYAEIGLAWTTRVFKETNWLRLRYGFSFQFNGLKPTDNRYFVESGEQTVLQDYPLDLDKSKFRMDNLVVPVFFEIGPSRKIEKENYFRYSTNHSFKVGFGGYAGLNLSTRQKLKFDDNGEDVKQKLKNDYNTNNFVYGLAGYVGYADISLYLKYDLNTVFKNNPVEERNISLGIRWDWD